MEGTALARFHQLNRDTFAMNAFDIDLGVATLVVRPEENFLTGLELALNDGARKDRNVSFASLHLGLRILLLNAYSLCDVKLRPMLLILIPLLVGLVQGQLMKERE